MGDSRAEPRRMKALTSGWEVAGEVEGTALVSQVLGSSRMEEGKGSCPNRSFLFFIFFWVVECLWLVCVAAVRGLRTQQFLYFSLSLPISLVAKCFCLVAKAPHDRSVRRAWEGRALMGLPPPRLYNTVSCSSLLRSQPHDVRRPWCATLWDAEQLPWLPGTVMAVRVPSAAP